MTTISELRLALVALACCVLLPATALACGGFFCFQQPIDQSAERVLYIQQPGQITVHIQISYTGDDDKFSWILPLQSVPELGIGSDSVFQLLEQGTAPYFQLEWQNKKDCHASYPCPMADGGGGGNGGPGGGVDVLLQQNVGPYNAVVLKSKSADELLKWLNDNGYVQPKETKPLIKSYVDKEHVFLALKLQKDKGAGDIQPIVVTLDEVGPCLPIRLTSVAAQPDMPVVTWTLGPHRAIPKNFLHVILNEATIDWMTAGGNYKTVVSKAVDQASGHAFTTEYAQPAKKFTAKFHNDKWDTSKLESIATPGKFMMALLQYGYPRTSQMQALIRKYIPKPKTYQSVPDNEFYNCLTCEGCKQSPCSDYKAAVAKQSFDPVAFAKAIEEGVVEPLAKVQGAFDTLAYLTRLYTTIDPAEMDKDPIFGFNPDLPDIERVRTAKAHPICKPGKETPHKAKIVFTNGHEITVDVPDNLNSCAFGPGFGGSPGFGKGDGPINADGGQPAWKVEVLDESGPPLEIDPSAADKVDAALNDAKLGKKSLSAEFIASLPDINWNPKSKDDPTGGVEPDPDKKPVDEDAGTSVVDTNVGGGVDAGGAATGGPYTPARSTDSTCSASPVGGGAVPGLLLLLAAAGLLVSWRRRETSRA